jgi:small subunit ribosomal protein S8
MPVNDPVGDMLTRIRNASRARHDKVVMPTSKMKVAIARVLKDQGYIADFVQHDLEPQGEITLQLKYGPDKSPVITGIRRMSKPGLRRYVPVRNIRPVLGGMGISILSTSKGILSDAQARQENIGGELICTVY